MSANLRVENILIQVKCRLQALGIKLWLEPYHTDDLGPCELELERLAQDFASVLHIPASSCLSALGELQNTAIDKLRARREFEEDGLATIKVRAPTQSVAGTRLITVKTPLSHTGYQFRELVAETLQLPAHSIKLINSGKFFVDELTLEQQNIRNNQQVMAIVCSSDRSDDDSNVASGSSSSMVDDNNLYAKLAKAREDALLLTSKQNSSYMHMEDQAGNAIHLPPAERRSLMMALALHEKGKSALKKERYSEALVMLMEADAEYQSCNSDLLQSVDNWALLNLDIVWCFLCLRSVSQLPEAEKRLHICEKNFKKSYGENLNRVQALKGNAANERALIMRLHLLMGVVMFHQNRRSEAQAMLQIADSELSRLRVSETSLTTLVEMGYDMVEARIALRACDGIVENAVTHIVQQRETRKEARRRGQTEHHLKIGKSKDKSWVNPRSLQALLEMGFEKDLCEVALRKTNNNIDQSVHLLQTNETDLRQHMMDDFVPDEGSIAEMKLMGFDDALIKLALRHATNNMNAAIESLLKMQADGTYESLLNNVSNLIGAVNMESSSEDGAVGGVDRAAEELARRAQFEQDTMEAFERFSEDINPIDDDHLDLPLIQEDNILQEYKRYLNQ